MAWSGDIFQQNVSSGTNLQFVIPSEGGTLWTDNFTIPITAANPVDAMELINFFYDPAIAASLAEYINYITPVPAAQPIIASDAAAASGDDKTTLEAVAKSPLVFPSDSDYAKLHYYRDFTTAAEHQAVQRDLRPDRDVVIARSTAGEGSCPYLTILPGGLWLVIFFVVPMIAMLSLSLQQGDVVNGFVQTWHWQTYVTAIENYRPQLIRSLEYGADLDGAADRDRLPDRVLDRVPGRVAQVVLPVPAAAAVLRVVRAPHDLVELHPGATTASCSAR